MHKALFAAGFAFALVVSTQLAIADREDDRHNEREHIQVGPRPFYLVEGMDDSALKSKLLSCEDEPVHRGDRCQQLKADLGGLWSDERS